MQFQFQCFFGQSKLCLKQNIYINIMPVIELTEMRHVYLLNDMRTLETLVLLMLQIHRKCLQIYVSLKLLYQLSKLKQYVKCLF